MRQISLFAIACALASAANADQFPLSSRVTHAELYPQGATLTRTVPFDVPAGTHELLITDLPLSVPLEDMRVTVDGARMGSVTLRRDALPPRTPGTSPEIDAAQAEIDRLRDAITATNDQIAQIDARKQAAQIALTALAAVQITPSLDGDPAGLGALVDSLTARAETAMAQSHAADQDMRPLRKTLDAQTDALKDAEDALAALQPDDGPRGLVSIAVTADQAAQGAVILTYVTRDAAWSPVYDIHLARMDGLVTIDRGALISQSTGEPWRDVDIALSTAQPSGQITPSGLWPDLRRVMPPAPEMQARMTKAAPLGAAMSYDAAPPMTAETHSIEGIRATYTYPETLSVASGVDALRIELGSRSTQAEVFARAVPSRDMTAFMATRFTNDGPDAILPAMAAFYMDGNYVGRRAIDAIPTGSETELSFGPIDGLQLSQYSRANEGDAGMLSSKNERSETNVYEVSNQTGLPWDVRLLAQVPYSEQDDLRITWDAKPRPAARDFDQQQGIHEWRFTAAPDSRQTIEVSHTLRWPDGLELH